MAETATDSAAIEKLRRRGRFVDLAAALEERSTADAALDGPFRHGGPDRVELAARLHDLGRVQWHLARFDAAERHLTRALALREQLLGPLDPRTLDTRERLAALYHYRVDDRAEPLFREVLAQRESVHGAESAEVAIAQRNLGALLRDKGDGVAAAALFETAVKQLKRHFGTEHPEYAAVLKAQAFLFVEQPHVDNSTVERLAVDALVATVRAHDVDHPFAGAARLLVARAEMRARRYSGAAREVARALASLRGGYGNEHPLVGIALVDDGTVRLQQGDASDAYDRLRRGAEMLERWYPRGPSAARLAYDVTVAACAAARPHEAHAWIARASDAVAGDREAQRTLIGSMLQAASWTATSGELDAARLLVDHARELDANEQLWEEHIEATAAHVAACADVMPE